MPEQRELNQRSVQFYLYDLPFPERANRTGSGGGSPGKAPWGCLLTFASVGLAFISYIEVVYI